MNFIKTEIADVVIIEPKVFQDKRGYFFESYRADLFQKAIGNINFIQDNESFSSYGVLRGLHYQIPPFAQTKLVRVVKGKILDVAVDIRKDSKTFKQFVAVELSDTNRRQLFIPRGFAHGFIVLSDTAIVNYKVDNYYSKECDRGILYSEIELDWGVPNDKILLSEKDLKQPTIDKATLFSGDLYG